MMKKINFRFLKPFMLAALVGITSITKAQDDDSDAHQAWVNAGSNARIVLDSDGNEHDSDDWAASAATLAIIANQGLKSNVVAYTYSNHIWGQSTAGDENMDLSVLGTAEKFGFDAAGQNFIDAYSDNNGAYNAIRDAINASSASDPLFMILAGPMEVAWQGVNRSDASKRKYVYCISHSNWNDDHASNDHGGHNWDELNNLGVHVDHIKDQNANRFNTGNMSSWNFLKDLASRTNDGFDDAYDYTYTRIDAAYSAGDASDCGMVYYLFTGDEDGNTTKLNDFMSNPPDPTNPQVTLNSIADVIEEGSSIVIAGTATDPNGSITKIECFDNGTSIGQTSSSPYSFTINNPSVEEHTFKVVATDNDGKTGQKTVTTRVTGCTGVGIKIEAENFVDQKGFKTEACSDTGNGENLGYTDVGDWAEYCVNIPSDGTYKLELRTASPNSTGKAQILLDGEVKTTKDIPNTNGWQTWETIETATFNATKGTQTLKINVTGKGFNINWIKLVSEDNSNDTEAPTIPTGLAVSNISQTGCTLNWNASSDNVGVSSYNVLQNGSFLKSVSGTSTNITGLTCKSTFTFTVKAKDAAGNISAASNAKVVTTSDCSTNNDPVTTTITATQDAYLQGTSPYNNSLIRVEAGNRVGYLMFDLSTITGTITDAKLKLTCNSDAGSGNIDINLGTSNNWSETNLSNSNKPGTGTSLASNDVSYKTGTSYDWDLKASAITGGGKTSLIVSQTNGNDVAFASKENSATAPQLIISYVPENKSTKAQAISPIENTEIKIVKSIENIVEVKIFPNPTSDILNINLSKEVNNDARLLIFNTSGKNIHSEQIHGSHYQLSVNNLCSGVYMLQIINGNEIITKRFIKK